MLHTFFFSPSGTTKKTVEILSDALGMETSHHDLTIKPENFTISSHKDMVLIAAPVYAGRIPPLAANRLTHVKGNGQKAIVTVVYGNRDYDDALLELCDIAEKQGFELLSAGAFIGEHCIFPSVATGRPDSEDTNDIQEYAEQLIRLISFDSKLELNNVKGNRPYKKISGVPLHPKVDKKLCDKCGKCARECPTVAIPVKNPQKTDGSKCITCCRCIKVCPNNARKLGGLLYKIAGRKFIKENTRRLDPEWYT